MQAIENLSPEKASDKTILHELAFNDDNDDVSLAALEKLNVFALWLKMSQIAKSPRVKRVCEKKVSEAVHGQSDIALTRQEKAAFLTESANNDQVTQIVQKDPSVLGDDNLARALIEKVDKAAFTQFVFLNGASEALRANMVNEQSDIASLQKLAKKVSEPALLAHIDARIEAIKLAEQKPVELRKQLTLSLSKYQALLDKTDVELVIQRQDELESELAGLFSQADILNEDERAALEEKQARIAEQVARYLARIRPAWEAEQQAQSLANTKALAQQQVEHATQQVNWLFGERLCDATLADVATVNESVRGLEATIEQLVRQVTQDSEASYLQGLNTTVKNLNAKLDDFSMQQQYGQKLLVRLQNLESLAESIAASQDDVATSMLDEFADAKRAYIEAKDALIQLPQTFGSRYANATKQVNAITKAAKAERAGAIKAVKKQLTLIDNLIAQGKFRAAIVKFNKVKDSFVALTDNEKSSLNKRFEKTQDDVSRLAGWQDYLAAPRKPALVEEAEQLAATQVDNIKARSDAIKYLRKQWLSLTTMGDDAGEKDSLQNAFDEALERAFEPCRAHYAELDAKRAAALENRQSIIANVKALDSDMPTGELAKAYDKLAKQWHAAGQVERSNYEVLKQEWKSASSELVAKINQWQQENQTQKRKLVDDVKALSAAEDVAEAASQAQALQAQWKQVGHAGKREESRLWAEFKSANDTVFERLKAERKSQNHAFNAQVENLLSSLQAVDKNLSDSAFKNEIQPIKEALQSLPSAHRAKIERKVTELEQQREAQALDAMLASQRERVDALNALLSNASEQDDVSLETLKAKVGKRWTSLLEQAGDETSSHVHHDRQWLTVALEVATDMPSPQSDASIRSSVQLQIMTAKLEQGEAPDAAALLSDWILVGPIENADKALVSRVTNVLASHPEVVA
jgi:hypothetical protein